MTTLLVTFPITDFPRGRGGGTEWGGIKENFNETPQAPRRERELRGKGRQPKHAHTHTQLE